MVLGQNKYKIVILPNVEQMSIETYRKFEEFARGGGILIATRRTPSQQPGFLAREADHQHVATLSKRLFEGSDHFVADEKKDLRSTLQRLLPPDVELSPATSDVGFVHRRTPDAEI